MSHPSDRPSPRRAAVTFIFITVVLDVLALGIIVPVLPPLVVEFLRRRHRARRGSLRPVRHRLGADAVRRLARARRAVRSLRPAADHPAVDRRARVRLHPDGAGAQRSGGCSSGGSSRASRRRASRRPRRTLLTSRRPISVPRASGSSARHSAWASCSGPRSVECWAASARGCRSGCRRCCASPTRSTGCSCCRSRCRPSGARDSHGQRANPLGSLRLLRSHPELFGLAGVTLPLLHRARGAAEHVRALHRLSIRVGPGTVGLTLALVGVCTAIVSGGLVGPIVKRLGERRAALTGLACGVAAFSIYGLAPTGSSFLAGVPVMAFWSLYGPSAQGMMSKRVSPSEQGQLQGAIMGLQRSERPHQPVHVHVHVRDVHLARRPALPRCAVPACRAPARGRVRSSGARHAPRIGPRATRTTPSVAKLPSRPWPTLRWPRDQRLERPRQRHAHGSDRDVDHGMVRRVHHLLLRFDGLVLDVHGLN